MRLARRILALRFRLGRGEVHRVTQLGRQPMGQRNTMPEPIPDIRFFHRPTSKSVVKIFKHHLIIPDETWTRTNMAPLRGWAPRGARLVAKVPHGRWKTQTFIAALRHDRIEAPWVLNGPINGECFKTYVEKVLAPTLTAGDLVILDNLGSHKGKAIRRAIRSVGAKLFFLPKYSPDLNPIEQGLRQVKASVT
jgi:putative transposase